MRSFFRPLLILAAALVPTYFAYLFFFPNDFFLSKKAFINHPNFEYIHTPFKFAIYDKRKVSPEILQLISNPDFYLKRSKNRFKDNEKRTLASLEIGSKFILIKRFNFKNLYDWITKCPFRSSKAFRSWYYAYLLKEKGIETIEPIAIIEKRLGPFWTYSYLITEYIEGQTLLSSYSSASSKTLQKICGDITSILGVFYRFKCIHRDFIGQNILITPKGVAVIDLDEMHTYAFNNSIFKKKFFEKHLIKLLRNTSKSSNFSEIFLMTHNLKSGYNTPAIRFEKELYHYKKGNASHP